MTYVDVAIYDKPSVLIPRKGSLTNLFYVDSTFWNVDTIYYTEIDTSVVLPKFFYYLLCKEHIERLNIAGGVPSLTQEVLGKTYRGSRTYSFNALTNIEQVAKLKPGKAEEIRAKLRLSGFNSIFAVSSVKAAKELPE